MIFETRMILALACTLAVVFLAVVTGFAEVPTTTWWLMGWRYCRLQVLALAVLFVLVAPLAAGGRYGIALALVAGGVALLQVYRVELYNLRFWVDSWEDTALRPELTLLTLNVQMDSDARDEVLRLVRETPADVVLLLEVDDAWLAELECELGRWPHQVRLPRDDFYGLVMLSRREVDAYDVVELGIEVPRPAIWMDVRTPTGLVRVWGLHPEPPHPGTDADRKEAYLSQAARAIAASPHPVVAMGDMNDVAWSPSTQDFLIETGLDDPRRGRGLFATFDARSWWMRWPIDHVFVDRRLACVQLVVGAAVGSDHFPVLAAVAHRR